MSTYVALLRGIGPGNPNMTGAKLRLFFEELGFTNVRTVLASGNVIFESDDDQNGLAERIEKALPGKLGFSRGVIVKSKLELQHLIDLDPFKVIEHDHNKDIYLLITFFKRVPNVPFKLPHSPEGKPYTILGKSDDVFFGTVDISVGKTPDYMSWLEKNFGKGITSRTPRTIRLILAKMNKARQ